MGIRPDLIPLIELAVKETGMPREKCAICELGNQRMRFSKNKTLKAYMRAQGYKGHYVSIDWNGKDGALKYDLSKPLPEELHGKFDVVTNFGVSEHVENQEQVFRNIYELCRPGGCMVHAIPCVIYGSKETYGDWKGHSLYVYLNYFVDSLTTYLFGNIPVVCSPKTGQRHILLQRQEGFLVCGIVKKDPDDLPWDSDNWELMKLFIDYDLTSKRDTSGRRRMRRNEG